MAETFWPHSDEVKGRHSLRQMLYRLKEMGFTLDEDGELLSLSPSRVRCDLTDALREDWIIEADEAAIAAAYDALPGVTRRFSERYSEWMDGVRARLESQFRRAALRVLADAKSEGRWYDVERWALMLLRSDPLNESAVLARAEGTAMLGSKAEAIMQLDRYLDELGPNAERIGLPARLLQRRIKELSEHRSSDQQLPLVGREDIVKRLTENMHGRESPSPYGYFLYGPAGIGKTRLISECAEFGALNGMSHIDITLTERDIDRPYTTLIHLSQRLLEQRGCIGADPRAIALAQRAHKPYSSGDEMPLPGIAVITTEDIAWATEQLLSATLEEGKLVITVDNAQHSSEEDLTALSRILVRQNPARLAWYLAGRVLPPRALRTSTSSARALATPVHLSPLTPRHATVLAVQVLTSIGHTASEEVISNTIALSGGNPLFIQELARSVRVGTPNQRLTQTLQKTISERLSQLTPEHLEICRAVCLLATEATLANIRGLCSSSPVAQTEGIASLESEGILRAGSRGVIELHDCWRLAIDEAMSPLTRAMLAVSAADLLASRANAQASPDTMATAAHLYGLGSEHEKAFHNYISAGRILYERGLCFQALALLSKAEPYSQSAEDTLDLLCVRSYAEHALGDFTSAVQSASRGLALTFTPSNKTRTSQTTLTAVLADASWKAGLPHEEALSRLKQLVTSHSISRLAREHGCFIGIRLAYNSRADHLAEHFLKWCSPPNNQINQTAFSALTYLVHQAERGSTPDVLAACTVLRQIDTSTLPLQYSLLTQRYISQSLRWAGDYSTAVDVAEAAYTEALRIGNLDEAAMLAIQIAFTELDMSHTATAEIWINRAESNSPPPHSNERLISLRHAHSRLLLQQSLWTEAYNLLIPHIETILNDGTLRRRLAESSCAILAAAKCQKKDLALKIFYSCKDFVYSEAPSLQTDFPVSAIYRALNAIEEVMEAQQMLDNYCRRRAQYFPRPVAPLFLEIAAALNDLPIS